MPYAHGRIAPGNAMPGTTEHSSKWTKPAKTGVEGRYVTNVPLTLLIHSVGLSPDRRAWLEAQEMPQPLRPQD